MRRLDVYSESMFFRRNASLPNYESSSQQFRHAGEARLVWDPVPETDEPQQGLVLLAYFTKVGLHDSQSR